MHKSLIFAAMMVLTAALIGACCCGGGSSSSDFDELFEEIAAESMTGSTEFGASCNDSGSLSQCTEYTKGSMELLGEDFYKGMCELTSGVWGADKCPTADSVGSCDDGVGSKTYYYTTGGLNYTGDSAKEACSLTMGTFTAQ